MLVLSPSAADNKVPDNEEDDNAAAVKIQVKELCLEELRDDPPLFIRLPFVAIAPAKTWTSNRRYRFMNNNSKSNK